MRLDYVFILFSSSSLLGRIAGGVVRHDDIFSVVLFDVVFPALVRDILRGERDMQDNDC